MHLTTSNLEIRHFQPPRLNACILISQGALRLAKGINSGQLCAVEKPYAGSDAPKVTATGSDRDTLGHHADAGSPAREPVEALRRIGGAE